MACGLRGATLLDPNGGLEDLRHRQLPLLPGGSLQDDPTWIVRAVRLGFSLERSGSAPWPAGPSHGDREDPPPWPLLPLAPACGWSLISNLSISVPARAWWPCTTGAPSPCWIGAPAGFPLAEASAMSSAIRPSRPDGPACGSRGPLDLAERLQISQRENPLLGHFTARQEHKLVG